VNTLAEWKRLSKIRIFFHRSDPRRNQSGKTSGRLLAAAPHSASPATGAGKDRQDSLKDAPGLSRPVKRFGKAENRHRPSPHMGSPEAGSLRSFYAAQKLAPGRFQTPPAWVSRRESPKDVLPTEPAPSQTRLAAARGVGSCPRNSCHIYLKVL
jgi:hypothetical protein